MDQLVWERVSVEVSRTYPGDDQVAEALRWISEVFARTAAQYQVVGGLAARAYGATRPLALAVLPIGCASAAPQSSNWAEAANDAETTVVRLFAALEQQDYEGATALVTPDFELVEDTLIMDMPGLVELARSYAERGATMKREFDDFRTEVRGEVAWTRYRHDGALSMGDRRIDLHWIETAILEKVDGEWRIDRMHSTPVRRSRN